MNNNMHSICMPTAQAPAGTGTEIAPPHRHHHRHHHQSVFVCTRPQSVHTRNAHALAHAFTFCMRSSTRNHKQFSNTFTTSIFTAFRFVVVQSVSEREIRQRTNKQEKFNTYRRAQQTKKTRNFYHANTAQAQRNLTGHSTQSTAHGFNHMQITKADKPQLGVILCI